MFRVTEGRDSPAPLVARLAAFAKFRWRRRDDPLASARFRERRAE
jgi:hypothetical protein